MPIKNQMRYSKIYNFSLYVYDLRDLTIFRKLMPLHFTRNLCDGFLDID